MWIWGAEPVAFQPEAAKGNGTEKESEHRSNNIPSESLAVHQNRRHENEVERAMDRAKNRHTCLAAAGLFDDCCGEQREVGQGFNERNCPKSGVHTRCLSARTQRVGDLYVDGERDSGAGEREMHLFGDRYSSSVLCLRSAGAEMRSDDYVVECEEGRAGGRFNVEYVDGRSSDRVRRDRGREVALVCDSTTSGVDYTKMWSGVGHE